MAAQMTKGPPRRSLCRRLSKNSLAPSGRGLRPQAVGERASRRHEGFGQRRGSLPPALRATAPPLAQAPPPPYRGSLSPRGRFLTRGGTAFGGPFVGGYILSAARTPTKRELCGIALENFLLYCRMPGFDWAFIFWLTFAGGQTKSSRMGVKMSSRTPGSRASQPWMMPSVFSIVSPAVTSRTSPPMVKRKRPDTT